ncbi:MAG: YceI family protein [Candidatus Polarisedimenticolaceae bacterium]|nr:YceI family protein [Candidatus Polarisedimenticolaceae bacterium]
MKHAFNSRGVFSLLALLLLMAPTAWAQNYKIDPSHSFVQFRISHLGFSILNGRFNDVSGHFLYDKGDPETSFVKMEVKTGSIDSNHAERDKHLRGEHFLHADKFPVATFNSISFSEEGKTGTLIGELTLHGVTRQIELYVQRLGEGSDPWGGYRLGFKAQGSIKLKEFDINYDLGPASEELRLDLYIEGIRAY